MASINQGDDAVERLDNAVTAFELIMTGAEGQAVPVPGHQDQPTLAERVKQNLKPSTDAAAGYAATARDEANRAAQEAAKAKQISGLETVADAVRLAVLPVPDVSIPFTTDGQLLHGKGTPVLVGTIPVAQMVSYERLGSQTMLDKSGRLVTVPAGEMAIEQQGLAIFDQSVNLAAPSINWTASANAAAPWVHGAADEFGWRSVSGSGDTSKTEGSYKDFIVTTNDTPHTFSIDVLKTTGMNVNIRAFGGVSLDVTLTASAATGPHAAEAVVDMGSYWRVEATRTFSGSSLRVFRIYPIGSSVGSAGAMSYRRVQLEAKPFATPYIENETSAQTARPATTRCDIPWPGNLQPLTDTQQITIALEFDTAGVPASGTDHVIYAQGTSPAKYFMLRVETNSHLRIYRNALTHQYPVLPRTKYRVCVRINKNICDLFVGGAKSGSPVTSQPNVSGLTDVLRLGNYGSVRRCLNGHLRSITIWNTPLTDIQCQAASS